MLIYIGVAGSKIYLGPSSTDRKHPMSYKKEHHKCPGIKISNGIRTIQSAYDTEWSITEDGVIQRTIPCRDLSRFLGFLFLCNRLNPCSLNALNTDSAEGMTTINAKIYSIMFKNCA